MESIMAVVLGAVAFAVFGSFANVVVVRLPRRLEEPNRYGELWDTNPWGEVVGGRSRCDSCGAEVSPVRNIPILSYLLLRGRCADCGEPIGVHHILIEVAAVVLYLWAVWVIGWSWMLLPLLVVIVPGLVISAIDFTTLMVPTRVVWPVFFVVVVSCVVAAAGLGEWDRLLNAAIGLAVLAGPLFAIWFLYPRGMGFGDVRLATMLGPIVGFVSGTDPIDAVMLALVAMAVSSIIGLVIGVVAFGARGRKAKVPFGPSMILGCWICSLYAPEILSPITG